MTAASRDTWDPRQQKAREEFERMREQMRRNIERSYDHAAERERLAIAMTVSARRKEDRFGWFFGSLSMAWALAQRSRWLPLAAAIAAAFVAGAVVAAMIFAPRGESMPERAVMADAGPVLDVAPRAAEPAEAVVESATVETPTVASAASAELVETSSSGGEAAPASAVAASDPLPAGRVERIRQIQALLGAMHYAVGRADGDAGPQTLDAAAEFAAERGLADGNLDAALLAALRDAEAVGHDAGVRVLPSADPVGAQVARVREAQRLLAQMGYEPGPADGDAGGRTIIATARFATELELDDPNLDDAFVAALRMAAADGHRAGAVASNADPVTGRVLRTREAQTLLAAMGYDPGRADGDAGLQTIDAAAAFAADRGLSSATIDTDMIDALRLAIAEGHRAGLARSN